MLKVKGIYDGTKVILSEPLPLPPNSAVEVLILEPSTDVEAVYWQQLFGQGLIKEICPQPTEEQDFTPVHVTGTPISQKTIGERR
ncbi:MAG: hypothetical protein ACYTEQ_22280 [Planctomycetota bacterium]|jgi:hypothetical protein